MHIPDGFSEGVYICPTANSTSEVTINCAGKVSFTQAEVSSGTWKSGIYAKIEGTNFRIDNLTGTGGAGDSLPPGSQQSAAVAGSPDHRPQRGG